jgi:hypothetical protein
MNYGAAHHELEKPVWDPNAKEESLEAYASWLNEIARAEFLENGSHPHMVFFVLDSGEISGYQLPYGMLPSQRDRILLREVAEIKPFGLIQISIKEIYHPKLYGQLNVRFIGNVRSDSDEVVCDCLLVRMLSRNGKEKTWANPILHEGDHLTLADCVITLPEKPSPGLNELRH